MRIPVRAGCQIIEFADEARARRILRAPNAHPIRARKSGRVVGIDLADLGTSKEPARCGNPLKYSHHNETDGNPNGVWTLKKIPPSTADIFAEVADGCCTYERPFEALRRRLAA